LRSRLAHAANDISVTDIVNSNDELAPLIPYNVAIWQLASFLCAAEFRRCRGIADMAGIADGSAWS
jgi:hypothetical protein